MEVASGVIFLIAQGGLCGSPFKCLSRIQAALVDLFWVELDWIPLAVLFLPEEEALLSASIVFRGCCLVLKTWCGDHWHTKSYNSLVV